MNTTDKINASLDTIIKSQRKSKQTQRSSSRARSSSRPRTTSQRSSSRGPRPTVVVSRRQPRRITANKARISTYNSRVRRAEQIEERSARASRGSQRRGRSRFFEDDIEVDDIRQSSRSRSRARHLSQAMNDNEFIVPQQQRSSSRSRFNPGTVTVVRARSVSRGRSMSRTRGGNDNNTNQRIIVVQSRPQPPRRAPAQIVRRRLRQQDNRQTEPIIIRSTISPSQRGSAPHRRQATVIRVPIQGQRVPQQRRTRQRQSNLDDMSAAYGRQPLMITIGRQTYVIPNRR